MSLPNPTTMEALLLYEELEKRGITVGATGDGALRVHPHSLLSDDDKERLKLHKGDLLEALGFKGGFSTATPATPATQGGNGDTYDESAGGTSGATLDDAPAESLPPLARRHLEEAGDLGLVARWSHEFGYISI